MYKNKQLIIFLFFNTFFCISKNENNKEREVNNSCFQINCSEIIELTYEIKNIVEIVDDYYFEIKKDCDEKLKLIEHLKLYVESAQNTQISDVIRHTVAILYNLIYLFDDFYENINEINEKYYEFIRKLIKKINELYEKNEVDHKIKKNSEIININKTEYNEIKNMISEIIGIKTLIIIFYNYYSLYKYSNEEFEIFL